MVLKRWPQLSVAVVLAITAYFAGGVAHHAFAGYSPATTFGHYSYSNSTCTQIVDPIGTVFTQGTGEYYMGQVGNHAQHHGGWGTSSFGSQRFYTDADGCQNQHSQAADGSFWQDRHHMRWRAAWTTITGFSFAATPHWEEVDGFTHCVPSDGFILGKNEIWSLWVQQGAHTGTRNSYWGNTEEIQKCGSTLAANNGFVDYIPLPH
jgi:hypothetical protein